MSTVAVELPAVDYANGWPGLTQVSRGKLITRTRVLATEPAAEFTLEALTARELCELPDPPESDNLLGPAVAKGQRVLVGGHTGEGKTTLSLAMARAITEGTELLDWTGPGNCRALVLDAEQGLKTVKRRLREAGLEHSDQVDYLRVPDGLALDTNEQHTAELEAVIRNGNYAVVVLDPLYKLHSGDSNVERAAVDLMRRLDAWRDEYHFALILPVHLRKPIPGERFSIHDIFGSSAYVRGAEVVLGIRRVSHGFAELFFLKDRDGDLEVGDKWGLLFDREDGYRRRPDDEDDEHLAAERLLAYVTANPGESTTKVTAGVEGRKKTLTRILETNEHFHMEQRGQSKRWFATTAQDPFPDTGNGWERVTAAQEGQPVPDEAQTPVGGLPTGTGEPSAVPKDAERQERATNEHERRTDTRDTSHAREATS